MQDNDNTRPKVTRKPLKLIYFKLHKIKPYRYSHFYAITEKKSELFDYRFHYNLEIPTIVNQV